jgi:hypothetical protein
MSKAPDKSSYAWHFLTRFNPIYLKNQREIHLFRRFVLEAADAHAGFTEKLRHASLFAASQGSVKLIRQALQCLAQVGSREDISEIVQLSAHSDSSVAIDLKTCIFKILQRPEISDNPISD